MKIKSIKVIGNADVYDVINSETENFLLENGTIVHNSMDEVNDMAWVESSTKARMKQYYSAAEESYREITERMNSRFPWETLYRQQKKYGFITCIGQSRFPDSFTEKKILEAQILGNESTTFTVRGSRWDMQPKERFSRETFLIDKTNKRVIEFLPINRYPDLAEKKCQYCFNNLTNGAYIANNGILVDTIDCYKQSFLGKIDVEKETA
jgi:hypothetical protein